MFSVCSAEGRAEFLFWDVPELGRDFLGEMDCIAMREGISLPVVFCFVF